MSAMHQFPPRIAYVVEEAMFASGLSRRALFKAMEDGRLRSYFSAGRRRIFPEDLETFLKGERPSPEPVSKMRSHVVSARA